MAIRDDQVVINTVIEPSTEKLRVDQIVINVIIQNKQLDVQNYATLDN